MPNESRQRLRSVKRQAELGSNRSLELIGADAGERDWRNLAGRIEPRSRLGFEEVGSHSANARAGRSDRETESASSRTGARPHLIVGVWWHGNEADRAHLREVAKAVSGCPVANHAHE